MNLANFCNYESILINFNSEDVKHFQILNTTSYSVDILFRVCFSKDVLLRLYLKFYDTYSFI